MSSARRTVSTVPGRPSVAHTWAAQYRIIPARVGLETAYLGPFLAVGAQSTLGSHTPRQWVSVPHTRPLSDPCACMLRIFVFVSVLKLFERPKEGSVLPPPTATMRHHLMVDRVFLARLTCGVASASSRFMLLMVGGVKEDPKSTKQGAKNTGKFSKCGTKFHSNGQANC